MTNHLNFNSSKKIVQLSKVICNFQSEVQESIFQGEWYVETVNKAVAEIGEACQMDIDGVYQNLCDQIGIEIRKEFDEELLGVRKQERSAFMAVQQDLSVDLCSIISSIQKLKDEVSELSKGAALPSPLDNIRDELRQKVQLIQKDFSRRLEAFEKGHQLRCELLRERETAQKRQLEAIKHALYCLSRDLTESRTTIIQMRDSSISQFSRKKHYVHIFLGRIFEKMDLQIQLSFLRILQKHPPPVFGNRLFNFAKLDVAYRQNIISCRRRISSLQFAQYLEILAFQDRQKLFSSIKKEHNEILRKFSDDLFAEEQRHLNVLKRTSLPYDDIEFQVLKECISEEKRTNDLVKQEKQRMVAISAHFESSLRQMELERAQVELELISCPEILRIAKSELEEAKRALETEFQKNFPALNHRLKEIPLILCRNIAALNEERTTKISKRKVAHIDAVDAVIKRTSDLKLSLSASICKRKEGGKMSMSVSEVELEDLRKKYKEMLDRKRRKSDGILGFLDERIDVLERQRNFVQSAVEDMPRAQEGNRLAELDARARELEMQLEDLKLELREIVGWNEGDVVMGSGRPRSSVKRVEILRAKRCRK
jgi:hypothetical protein